jgi:CheY-specific phosphatase CheX
MSFSEEDLRTIVSNVFNIQLGMELDEPTDLSGKADLKKERTVTSSVQITGEWKGAVHLQSTYRLAQRATAIMFGMEEDELSDDDIPDAFGELANMIAGNFKALLEGVNYISLPIVVEGSEHIFVLPDAEILFEIPLSRNREPLLISVLRESEDKE